MENKKNTDEKLNRSEKNGAFQQSIISEQIKKRPINKYRLLRRTLMTALLAIVFGIIASVTIWILEPVLSKWISRSDQSQGRDAVHFIDTGDDISAQEVLQDYMEQEAVLGREGDNSAAVANLPLTNEQIQVLFSQLSLDVTDYRQIYQSMSSYVREMSKSIVTITAITSDTDWIGTIEQHSKQASGLIVAEDHVDLYIIADRAPLAGAQSLAIQFSTGYVTEGKVKATDEATGLVMISVKISDLSDDLAANIPLATLGSTYASVGTPVCALGSPLGSVGSIGYGMINASRSTLEYPDTADTLLQTNIVGSDNAGGFLFNYNGQVIGVIAPDQKKSEIDGLICAYGISELKSRISAMATGKPGVYLGVIGTYVTNEANSQLGVPYGAYVLRTEMDSPAMLAGIRTGDVIVRLGDTPITSYTDYVNVLQTYEVGDKITAAVMRKSQLQYVELEYVMTARSSGIIFEED
ncbi:MAG: PDZ domain-containing protein [Lachnospiraceae bacterium]|nr:PDZ domain-containing protein [Lachnospiraceae bacterium]